MMLDRLYTRSLDSRLLCSDPLINKITSLDFVDWDFIHQCYKSVSHLPIPHPSKEFLKSHLFSSIGMELLEINNPTILVCRLPNGEVRSFVTTQSGFLLEHEENFCGTFISVL